MLSSPFELLALLLSSSTMMMNVGDGIKNMLNVEDVRTMAPSRFFPSEEWVAVPQEVDMQAVSNKTNTSNNNNKIIAK